jgi:hypothetical protein
MKRVVRATVTAALLAVLAGCSGGDVTRSDLPTDVAEALPSISLEEAKFVVAAKELGVDVTGASVGEDLETAKTVCWALKEGGVQVKDIAAELNQDDALRTKRIIRAGIESLCPDYADQVGQLDLPE